MPMMPPVATTRIAPALDLRPAPLAAGHHALRALAAPCLALALARLALGELGSRLRRRCGRLARFNWVSGLGGGGHLPERTQYAQARTREPSRHAPRRCERRSDRQGT